jgi:uncharacterized membrane protein YccF (DUF307 family)
VVPPGEGDVVRALGIASFKLAGYALWPFGRAVTRDPSFRA